MLWWTSRINLVACKRMTANLARLNWIKFVYVFKASPERLMTNRYILPSGWMNVLSAEYARVIRTCMCATHTWNHNISPSQRLIFKSAISLDTLYQTLLRFFSVEVWPNVSCAHRTREMRMQILTRICKIKLQYIWLNLNIETLGFCLLKNMFIEFEQNDHKLYKQANVNDLCRAHRAMSCIESTHKNTCTQQCLW